MDVNPEVATAQGLRAEHDGQTYYFCGRGCKLELRGEPERSTSTRPRPDHVAGREPGAAHALDWSRMPLISTRALTKRTPGASRRSTA